MSETSVKPSKKIIPIVADNASEEFISLYQSEKKIFPRKTSGFYTNWRWVMFWITQIVFFGTPWLTWGDRQAFLFDLDTHRFYIAGLILYPQDIIYLVVILIVSALALFLFTAVAGRLWCGFSCPQSVYTKIFLWMEHVTEGDRSARMRLDSAKYSLTGVGFEKLYKKLSKHGLWVIFSVWTGFTFLGYFTPIRGLFDHIQAYNLGPWETFWIGLYSAATYGNAGFLREQICKYMCPYARFQSAMFDRDTLIVTYDQTRGEPRSGRSRNVNAKEQGLGDCIDCSMCVQVCPVGIDIRNGLQYECISCGLCIDACNNIMDKMGYARGLIKMATENGMQNHFTNSQMLKRVFRPRVLIYSGILIAISIAFIVSLVYRTPFKVDVIRDRGVMARLVEGGNIENVYRMQIMNASEKTEVYEIGIKGIDGLKLSSKNTVEVGPAETRSVPVSVQIKDGQLESGTHPMFFTIKANSQGEVIEEKSVFYMPR